MLTNAVLEPGEFVHTLGDAHIYLNHLDQVKEQLTRTPHEAPKLILPAEPKPIDQYEMTDIKLEGYTHESAIKAPVAVLKRVVQNGELNLIWAERFKRLDWQR